MSKGKPYPKRWQLARGFTLVELLISMAIGLILLGTLGTVFMSNFHANKVLITRSQLRDQVESLLWHMELNFRRGGLGSSEGIAEFKMTKPDSGQGEFPDKLCTNNFGVKVKDKDNSVTFAPTYALVKSDIKSDIKFTATANGRKQAITDPAVVRITTLDFCLYIKDKKFAEDWQDIQISKGSEQPVPQLHILIEANAVAEPDMIVKSKTVVYLPNLFRLSP